jgi:hypothetical protein
MKEKFSLRSSESESAAWDLMAAMDTAPYLHPK